MERRSAQRLSTPPRRWSAAPGRPARFLLPDMPEFSSRLALQYSSVRFCKASYETGNLLLLGFALVLPFALRTKDRFYVHTRRKVLRRLFASGQVFGQKMMSKRSSDSAPMLERKGTRAQPGEAVNWYRIAAYQGHSKAQWCAGTAVRSGKGRPRNYVARICG